MQFQDFSNCSRSECSFIMSQITQSINAVSGFLKLFQVLMRLQDFLKLLKVLFAVSGFLKFLSAGVSG